jgi:YggT family protein
MLAEILYILYWILRVYFYVLIAYVLMSWIPELRGTKIHRIIHNIANPYMRIFRGVLVIGMIDLTPIIGFLLYQWGLGMLYQAIYLMAS